MYYRQDTDSLLYFLQKHEPEIIDIQYFAYNHTYNCITNDGYSFPIEVGSVAHTNSERNNDYHLAVLKLFRKIKVKNMFIGKEDSIPWC